ncbi:MAG: GNAT family N-acetyltransferase, partial [Thermoanaerobaculia bacterium]|nr:GNAT family N-acetyltransferase [Thermoanaerobaculia bacterium]
AEKNDVKGNLEVQTGLRIEAIVAEEGPTLASMTFPSYRHLLDLKVQTRHPELGEVDLIQPFGIVARADDRVVGLALAELPASPGGKNTDTAVLLSVFVRPEARRQGIATALVAAFEQETARRSFHKVGAIYTTGRPGMDWMEQVFAKRGWQDPVAASSVVHFTPQAALGSKFFTPRSLAHYQHAFEIFPWHEITAEDREVIERTNREQCWIEPALGPFKHELEELDPSSVGARRDGVVVGWVLNHRVSPTTVRHTIGYVRPDLARRAKLLALLHPCWTDLMQQGVTLCTFATPHCYPPMVAFIHRLFAPFASFVGESRRATHDLGSLAGDGGGHPLESVKK